MEISLLTTMQDYRNELLRWLISSEHFNDESSMKFLKSLNDFDLNAYIKRSSHITESAIDKMITELYTEE